MPIISFAFLALVMIDFFIFLLIQRTKRISDKTKATKVALLFSSYLCVIYADWRFALILALLSVATWFCANTNRTKLGVIIAILCLAVFKYLDFFIESFARLFDLDHNTLGLILPLGISFYTFSAISYLVDASKGNVAKTKFFDVALYLSYFPKLTSGPIQKSKDFFMQVQDKRLVGWNTFSKGIQIFAFGLFKKIVIADRLAIFVDQVYKTPKAFSSFTIVLAILAYSLQIYFDFSGYSDMAIGASEVLGITLPRNFNLPYLAHNVTEFWKRWHITLSEWLMEYVYIPLGGNRKGTVRTYFNLFLTMVIGGIWHGASWTFVIWGGMNGIALAAHKGWMTISKSDKRENSTLGKAVSVVLTFAFVSICWVFFRAGSLSKALEILNRIFVPSIGVNQPYTWLFITIVILLVASSVALVKSNKTPKVKKKENLSTSEGFYPIVDLSTMKGMILFLVFCGLIISFANTGGSKFIYGNF